VRVANVIAAHVRVNLGRDDVCVTEQRLHAAQIRASTEQVSSEGMPELVRVRAAADARRPRNTAHDLPERLAGECATAR